MIHITYKNILLTSPIKANLDIHKGMLHMSFHNIKLYLCVICSKEVSQCCKTRFTILHNHSRHLLQIEIIFLQK